MRWNLFRGAATLAVTKGPTIVADALIGTVAVAHGALVPLVIVDSSDRPDIDHVIKAHQYLPPGDVETQWGGSVEVRHRVVLVLDFVRPVVTQLVLGFDAVVQGALVDSIVSTNLLYVQGGRPGDRLATTIDAARMLVQVPSDTFAPRWERIFYDATYASFRARGLRRSQARRATRVAIAELRALTAMRLSGKPM